MRIVQIGGKDVKVGEDGEVDVPCTLCGEKPAYLIELKNNGNSSFSAECKSCEKTMTRALDSGSTGVNK